MAKKRQDNKSQQELKNQPIELKNVGVGTSKDTKVAPIRGMQLDEQQIINHMGIFEPYGTMYPSILRYICDTDPICQIAINLRTTQVREFTELNSIGDEDIPGWCIRMKNREKSPDKIDKQRINFLTDFMMNLGVKYDPSKDIDNIGDLMPIFTNERMVLDRVSLSQRFDKKGKLYDLIPYDGGTIKRVVPQGFQGDKSDFDGSVYYYLLSNEERQEIEKERIAGLPANMSDIKYVQIVDNKLITGFTVNEMILKVNNFNINIRRYGEGKSPVERAMQSIGAFIKSFKYNADIFDDGTIPKIALVMEQGGFDPKSLRAFQREFRANFQGGSNRDKTIPILNGKASILNLDNKSRDMEYNEYLQFCASLTFAAFGVDPAEVGLKLDKSQSITEENKDARQKFSKSRALNEDLKSTQNLFNRILKMNGVNDYEFHITGLNKIDKSFKEDLIGKMVSNRMTIDEVRAMEDKPPLKKGGDIVLNPTYLQHIQGLQQQEQQSGGFDEFGDEETPDQETDQLVDEAADQITEGMYKAKGRIMLM